MQSSSHASPSGPTGHFAAPAAPVLFSLLYQLRHATTSITARNSLSPWRLSGVSPPPSGPVPAAIEDGALGYVTPPRSSTHPTYTGLSHHPQGLTSSPSALAPHPTHRTAATTHHVSSSSPPPPPLLSTMDRRELSKVIVRDAVYARVLDLVPSRQHVQVAVWTLSPRVIQIDGAVAVCAVPREATEGYATASFNDPGRLSSFASPTASEPRCVVRERVRELSVDSSLFASLLKPYLGEVGCQGDVVRASVDGVSVWSGESDNGTPIRR